MDTPQNSVHCIVCNQELIIGLNWTEASKKIYLRKCKPCRNTQKKERNEKLNLLSLTEPKEKWLRISMILSDRIYKYSVKHGENTCDTHEVLLEHLKQKYPELPKVCPILGIELRYPSNKITVKNKDNSISLDRIDSSKPYVVGNVQILSNRANVLKSDGKFEEIFKLFLYTYNTNKELYSKFIKENGFVFFEKNNRIKNTNNEAILEKGGEGIDIGGKCEQILFDLINN